MTKNNENIKLLYDNVYDELNRSRDWPIKVLTFVSVLYITLLGFAKLDKNSLQLNPTQKWVTAISMCLITCYTILIIIKQHIEYLKYRNIQIRLQKSIGIHEWKVETKPIFPVAWQNEIKESMWKRCQGWLFYALYLITLTVISSFLLFHN